MFFPSTPTLPKVVDFKPQQTLVKLESGAVAMIGAVQPLNRLKESDNQTYLVELLNPVTLELLIAVRLYKDGGQSPCLNLLNVGDMNLGVSEVIHTPRITDAFALKPEDEILLDSGVMAYVTGTSEVKYCPQVIRIHLSNGETVVVEQSGLGVNGQTSILAVQAAPDDQQEDDDF